MTNLIETPVYEAGIFQLETTTPVIGGQPAIVAGNPVAGHSNAQALQLANRTAYLKEQVDDLDVEIVRFYSLAQYGGIGDGVFNNETALLALGAATTGVITIPAGDFLVSTSTVNSAAVLALLGRIRVDGKLSLTLAAGTHSLTSPVSVFSSGLNSNGVRIVGQTPTPISITGQISVSGAAGAYSVILSVNTTTGIALNDFLHTWTVAGTGVPEVHRGCWKITNVDGPNSQITVINTCRKASFPANTITSSSSSVLKTMLKFSNSDGFVVRGSRIDLLDNVAIVGNSDDYWLAANVSGTEKGTHGIICGALTISLNGKVDNVNPYGVSAGHVSCGVSVGINGFDQQGVVTELGGSFYGDFVSSCNNKRRGFYASTASGIRAKHISANGNFLDGVISDLGGDIYSSSLSCAVGNGQRGISAGQNGTIVFDTGIVSENSSDGAAAVLGGMIQATAARFENNVNSGILGEYGGVCVVNNSTSSGNGRYGLDLSFGSTARASSCAFNTNTLHGTRSAELSVAIVSGSTYSGNIVGDKTTRGDGIILDGSTYTLASKSAVDFKSIGGTSGQGARFASTSGGDDFQVSHDTTGAGTYTTVMHIRSGTGGMYPQTDSVYQLGRTTEKFSQLNCVVGLFTGPVKCGQYTLATLPSASTYNGYEIDVTDATGGSKRCRSNGTVWQILNTTTTVS